MVHFCSAYGCNNRWKRECHVRYYSFPFTDPEKSKSWTNAIGLKCAKPSKYTKICSEHFKQTDFKINRGRCHRLHLKNDAVPSVKSSPTSSSLSPQLSSSCISSSPPKKVPTLETDQYLSQLNLSSSTPNNLPTLPLIEEEVPDHLENPHNFDYYLEEHNYSCRSRDDSSKHLINKSNLISANKVNRSSFLPKPKNKTSQPDTSTKIELKKTIKALRQQIRRKDCKINSLKDVIKNMKEKGIVYVIPEVSL